MRISDQNPETETKSSIPDPADYWRRLCPVEGAPISLCGDLPHSDSKAADQLAEWVGAGITGIVDVRIEWNDESRVKRLHPELRYIWHGVDDAGGDQAPEWFDDVVEQTIAHLRTPDAHVVIHCHMGINRGPSMAFAILLALGWEPIEALNAIRTARPIAAVIYADSALRWWHDRRGSDERELNSDLEKLFVWQQENRIVSDLHWVISRIRIAGDSAA